MTRVPYMDGDQMLPETRDAYDQILGSRGQVLNIFQAMLNSPEAAKRLANLGEYLRFHGSLSNGLKETAILATAQKMRNHYVWAHHEILAREAEVQDEIIDDIRKGTVPEKGTPQQALVIQYTWQLLKNHMVTDDVFEQIHQCLGNEGVVDITLLIGFYATMSLMVSALKVNLESGVTSTLIS